MVVSTVILAVLNGVLMIFPVILIALAAATEYFPKGIRLFLIIYGVVYIILIVMGLFGLCKTFRMVIKVFLVILLVFALIQLIGGIVLLALPKSVRDNWKDCKIVEWNLLTAGFKIHPDSEEKLQEDPRNSVGNSQQVFETLNISQGFFDNSEFKRQQDFRENFKYDPVILHRSGDENTTQSDKELGDNYVDEGGGKFITKKCSDARDYLMKICKAIGSLSIIFSLFQVGLIGLMLCSA